MKYSVMTMPMAFSVMVKYHFDRDEEEMREAYCEMLDMIAEAGYAGVDVMDAEVRMFGMEQMKSALSERGLCIASYLVMEAFAPSDAGCIAVAKELGAACVMLVPAYNEEYDGMSGADIRAELIRRWTPIVQAAMDEKIPIVAEDTPDLRLHFCRREEVGEVLDGLDGLQLVYDSANMLLVGEDPAAYAHHFKGKIAHVHFKDMQSDKEDKAAFPGTGLVDLPAVMRTLIEDGYDGWLTVELKIDERGHRRTLADALAFARRCCGEKE